MSSRTLRYVGAAALLGATLAVTAIAATQGRAASVTAADAYEPDNSAGSAKVVPVDTVRTFSTATDADWVRVTASRAGQKWVIETLPLSGDSLNTHVTVYRRNADGSVTAVDGNDDHPIFPDTLASGLVFTAQAPGTYYVVARPAVSGAVGSYRLSIAPGIVRRLSGANRYAVAAEVSRLAWSNAGLTGWGNVNGPASVVVAGGTDVNGALAGSALAAANGTTLLLTPSSTLAPETRAEISRLGRVRRLAGQRVTVYVVGTTSTVASGVEASLRAIPEVGRVVRLAGADSYGTATRVAAEMKATAGISDTAFLVSSTAWADAIGAVPVAATAGAPVLFTAPADLPSNTRNALVSLGIRKVVIVGGTSSVSPAVAAQVAAITGSAPIRLGGSTRYSTARLVAEYGVSAYGMDPRGVVVASGQNYPDALAAGPLSWWTGTPVLLTPSTTLSPDVTRFIDAHRPRVLPGYVIGGPSSVSEPVMRALAERY